MQYPNKRFNYFVLLIPTCIFGFGVLAFYIYQIYFSAIFIEHIQNNDYVESLSGTRTSVEQYNNSVLFIGDVMLGRNVEYLSEISGAEYSTMRIKGQLPKTDAVVANFESAVAIPHIRTRAYTMQFSTAEWMLSVLTTLGVTHASLANNHSLDFGYEGYQNSFRELDTLAIKPFGHSTKISSSSVTVIEGTPKIGIVAINSIFTSPDKSLLKTQIEQLKYNTDIQVAYIHWGDEYEEIHNIDQETFAQWLVAIGVDLIVGHHPHVVQDIDMIDGVIVFYSLGNFIFDQYFSAAVGEGYTLLLQANESGELSYTIIPVTSNDSRSQPRLMTDNETSIFLKTLADRSNVTLMEYIIKNSLNSFINLAQDEEMSMITQ